MLFRRWDFKRIDYRYDLISGNVNTVFYQYGKGDQFVHRYRYDSDDRIVEVQTSSDRFIWNTEATYARYDHDLLARVEFGQYKVQATDYYYTLQGWIKGINMPYAGDSGKRWRAAIGHCKRCICLYRRVLPE